MRKFDFIFIFYFAVFPVSFFAKLVSIFFPSFSLFRISDTNAHTHTLGGAHRFGFKLLIIIYLFIYFSINFLLGWCRAFVWCARTDEMCIQWIYWLKVGIFALGESTKKKNSSFVCERRYRWEWMNKSEWVWAWAGGRERETSESYLSNSSISSFSFVWCCCYCCLRLVHICVVTFGKHILARTMEMWK